MSEQTATTVPPKGLGSVKLRDLWKGLYYIAISQVIVMLGLLGENILQEHPHFPTWIQWLPYLKAAVASLAAYLGGKLGVNNVGQIFQKDKPVVHVDVESLKELQEKANEAEK